MVRHICWDTQALGIDLLLGLLQFFHTTAREHQLITIFC